MVDKRSRRAASRDAALDLHRRLGPATGDERILHVDMDAFYASVEMRDHPELRGRAVIVGGTGNRGVVAAASYEARRYGVYSAMPISQARRLCPDGVYVSPDFTTYGHESKRIREIFTSFTPYVEPISLDEAYLDVGGAGALFGSPADIGAEIRRRIAGDRGLTASVGAATNKLVAKLASEAAKPDGLVCVPAGREREFLEPLPVAALWGVGAKTAAALERVGIRTVGELAAVPLSTLRGLVGDKSGGHLFDLARARAGTEVVVGHSPKSIGHEHTFETDLVGVDHVRRELLGLADRVGARLRRGGYAARTLTLKCRLASFKTLNRARTFAEPIDAGPEIYAAAVELWKSLELHRGARCRPIRLLGISGSGLIEGGSAHQLTLEPEPSWRDLMDATDAIDARFGSGAVRPARLLSGPASGRSVGRGPSEKAQPHTSDDRKESEDEM